MDRHTVLIDLYLAAWNETDAARRRELIAQAFTPDARYRDPLMRSEGHAGIDAMLQAVQERFAGHRFARAGAVDALEDSLRFSWTLTSPAGAPMARGTDFATLAGDGRLCSVTGFLDESGAAQAA